MSADSVGLDFIDSNVFVYLFDTTDKRKRLTARDLVDAALANDSACISYQVVQETLNVITRKIPQPLAPIDASRFMQHSLLPLWRVMPSAALYQHALDTQARYRVSFYDALIVAAALEAGCTRLYSEDLQHGQKFGRLSVHNPFRK